MHNSIDVEWTRLPIYMGGSVCYVIYISIYNIFLDSATYSFMNWYRAPGWAMVGVIAVTLYQYMAMGMVVYYSRHKLRTAAIDRWYDEPKEPLPIASTVEEEEFVPDEMLDDGFGFLKKKFTNELKQELTLVVLQ
jgi:hypothetical protein